MGDAEDANDIQVSQEEVAKVKKVINQYFRMANVI